MSLITDAVVHVGFIGDEGLIAQLSTPLPFDTTRGQRFQPLPTEGAGGVKVFTGDVLCAAFNYVATNDLVDWFTGLPWGPCDIAVLSAVTEGEAMTTVIVSNGQAATVRDVTTVWHQSRHRLDAEFTALSAPRKGNG